MSEDLAGTPFPTRDRDDLIYRYNTHRQWMTDAERTEKNAMTKKFTDKMKWINWNVTLINFLKYQTGMNGVPLNYIVEYNVKQIVKTKPNFLEN